MSFARFTQAILALLVGLAVAFGAAPAQAQTETVLHSFTYSDGAFPRSDLTSDSAGNLYGTTLFMGGGVGGVFELSPDGRGGWNETVLYRFTGGADGGYPYCPLILDSAGNLYGTTYDGGANELGVVFELSPAGAGWKETVLYSFAWGTDGRNPVTGLIMDAAGNLYGTTFHGNTNDGTVFELSPSGGGWTERVIYNVDTSYAGLTMDASGNIFGAGLTTVFELSPNGKGDWNPTVLHTFSQTGRKNYDGLNGTPVLDKAGNLYGTRYGGGGNATVYKLSPGKNGKWTKQVLQSFKNRTGPWAGVVLDPQGNIYGTTLYGNSGDGSVFELVAPVGGGNYEEKVLWSFSGADGAYPSSLILDNAGNLYGMTLGGGAGGFGVVFEVTP
ncbi:MAG: hypothetical protein LAO30_17140 [Acidobacteriia bacterium]|nr:hypothetical protein [Terriglobia bacterium]